MKFLTIIHRELLTRVRTKGFLIFTIGMPVLLGGFFFLEYAIINASQHVASKVAVVDLSQRVLPALESASAGRATNGSRVTFLPVSATAASLPAVEAQLRAQVLAQKLDGYLVIPADVLTSRSAAFHAHNSAAFTVNQDVSHSVENAVDQVLLVRAGVPQTEIQNVMGGSFHLEELKITAQGEHKDTGSGAILAIALTVILYMCLLIYGIVTMRAVTEEKTSRVSEVLLAAVDPFSLMMGKILGVAGTALSQLVVWGVCLALFAVYGIAMAQAGGQNWKQYVPHNAAWVYICFVLFFIFGFLLYASIYAAIGAMVSSEQEAQQTNMPLTLILVVCIYLAFLVMASPNSTLSVVLSLIPFFAPMLMLMRVAVSSPPLWQVLLAMALCIATFLACTRLTAKIYRVGILMTGKRPNLAELRRWLKYS
ncbi:MAG: ABC transporter permease [Terriglobales bacterium]